MNSFSEKWRYSVGRLGWLFFIRLLLDFILNAYQPLNSRSVKTKPHNRPDLQLNLYRAKVPKDDPNHVTLLPLHLFSYILPGHGLRCSQCCSACSPLAVLEQSSMALRSWICCVYTKYACSRKSTLLLETIFKTYSLNLNWFHRLDAICLNSSLQYLGIQTMYHPSS